jgi:tetratricopeptide (TPR) repeat protein
MAKRESVKARIERCAQAVEERPGSPVAHYNLGLAYTTSGRMEAAESSYLKALELDGDMIEAWVNLGGVRLHRWDFEGCLEACKEAIQRDDQLLIAHYNLGQAYLYMGDPEGVVRSNEKVLELDRDHAAGHYYMAVGLLALSKVGAAQRHLGRAMELGHRPTPDFMKAMEKAEKAKGAGSQPVTMEIG